MDKQRVMPIPPRSKAPALAFVERELAAASEHARHNRRKESLTHYQNAVQQIGQEPEISAEVARQF